MAAAPPRGCGRREHGRAGALAEPAVCRRGADAAGSGRAGGPRQRGLGGGSARRRAHPHVHIAQRLTVPITKRVFGTTYFWNPLQNFLLAKFKCASRVPSHSRSQGLRACSGPLLAGTF